MNYDRYVILWIPAALLAYFYKNYIFPDLRKCERSLRRIKSDFKF